MWKNRRFPRASRKIKSGRATFTSASPSLAKKYLGTEYTAQPPDPGQGPRPARIFWNAARLDPLTRQRHDRPVGQRWHRRTAHRRAEPFAQQHSTAPGIARVE